MSVVDPSPKPASIPLKRNRMHPIRWVEDDAAALLDVGCNAGEFLAHCREVFPRLRLAGVEINARALDVARARLPEADLRQTGAESLPFEDDRFDCVTCIEVLEHIPEQLRRESLAEMRRVLRPGGRLVLRVPHAGLADWLDPNNYRFRFRRLHRLIVDRGLRDDGYEGRSEGVVWHHHFRLAELFDLTGDGWDVETVRRGGFLLLPLCDAASWPFYRLRRTRNPLFRMLHRLAEFDLECSYGLASYDVLVVLRKAQPPDSARSPSRREREPGSLQAAGDDGASGTGAAVEQERGGMGPPGMEPAAQVVRP